MAVYTPRNRFSPELSQSFIRLARFRWVVGFSFGRRSIQNIHKLFGSVFGGQCWVKTNLSKLRRFFDCSLKTNPIDLCCVMKFSIHSDMGLEKMNSMYLSGVFTCEHLLRSNAHFKRLFMSIDRYTLAEFKSACPRMLEIVDNDTFCPTACSPSCAATSAIRARYRSTPIRPDSCTCTRCW